MLKQLFQQDRDRHNRMASAQVVPLAGRCVQCGICSFNCPVGIDVRRHAWEAVPVVHSRCLSCSECILRCPRGVLRMEYCTGGECP